MKRYLWLILLLPFTAMAGQWQPTKTTVGNLPGYTTTRTPTFTTIQYFNPKFSGGVAITTPTPTPGATHNRGLYGFFDGPSNSAQASTTFKQKLGGGVKVGVRAVFNIPKAGMVTTAVKMGRALTPVGVGFIGAGYVFDWLVDAGVEPNGAPGKPPGSYIKQEVQGWDPNDNDTWQCSAKFKYGSSGLMNTEKAAFEAGKASYEIWDSNDGDPCNGIASVRYTDGRGPFILRISPYPQAGCALAGWEPVSGFNCAPGSGGPEEYHHLTDDELRDLLNSTPIPSPSGVATDQIDVGETPYANSQPSVSGPNGESQTTVQGDATTSTGTTTLPGGATGTDTTTSTDTTYVTYQGDNIKYSTTNITSTTSTTINNLGDASTTTTTTTTDSPGTTANAPGSSPETEPFDLCLNYPNIIACMQPGDDPGPIEIQEQIVEVELTPVTLASNATCPAPAQVNTIMAGMLEMSYQPACDFANAMNPIVILLAWLGAGFILFGGSREA